MLPSFPSKGSPGAVPNENAISNYTNEAAFAVPTSGTFGN
jgi:hypothetical protein